MRRAVCVCVCASLSLGWAHVGSTTNYYPAHFWRIGIWMEQRKERRKEGGKEGEKRGEAPERALALSCTPWLSFFTYFFFLPYITYLTSGLCLLIHPSCNGQVGTSCVLVPWLGKLPEHHHHVHFTLLRYYLWLLPVAPFPPFPTLLSCPVKSIFNFSLCCSSSPVVGHAYEIWNLFQGGETSEKEIEEKLTLTFRVVKNEIGEGKKSATMSVLSLTSSSSSSSATWAN